MFQIFHYRNVPHHSTLWGKNAPFSFSQELCQTTLYFYNFGTDTEVNLQQNCIKIAHLTTPFATLLQQEALLSQ